MLSFLCDEDFQKKSTCLSQPAFSPVNISIETVITIQRRQKGSREFLRDNRATRFPLEEKKIWSSSRLIFSGNIARICGNDLRS